MERDKLFEVDPYGVVAEQRDHSLLSSSDSLPTTSQASYSLPGSRRNSTDAEDSSLMEAFDVKLKLQPPQQQQNQQHQHQQQQQQQEFVAPHRSMSVDETALKHKLHIGSSAANPSDKQRFLFDHDADRAPTRQPYLKRYGGSTETLSSFGHGDYSGFFTPAPNDHLDMVSSLRRSASRQNKSVESLRSKSWAQYLENSASPPLIGLQQAASTTNSLFGNQRRFSYGWPPHLQPPLPPPPPSSSAKANAMLNSSASGATTPTAAHAAHAAATRSSSMMDPTLYHDYLADRQHRLTTSHSYSDLHATAMAHSAAATRSASTCTASMHHHHHQHHAQQGHHPHNQDVAYTTRPYQQQQGRYDELAKDPLTICPIFQQYGICAMEDKCPYIHASPSLALSSFNLPPSPHPLSVVPTNYHPHALSQQQQQQQQQQQGQQQHPSLLYNSSFPGGKLAASRYTPPPSASSVASACPPGTPAPPPLPPSAASTTMPGLFDKELERSMTPRRSLVDPEASRFSGAKLEDFQGKLYDLCKDHNGCRFLQKKLEDPNGQYLQTIFDEIHPHFVELMTDPFGNYLCQKLVERCNDMQRTAIVDIIAPHLLQICLSMHGTRAIQKLIEFLSSSHQIKSVTNALRPNVVALIKDLNGNHVIQKCLNRLSAEHNQFIYDIVSDNCIEVSTHRHGCCVLQRCIDHAVETQKNQLVQVVTHHALPLVQDPFGNYVVQYVLDLGEVPYSDALVRRLMEHVCDLSVQKFSSNVIEKCIRVSEPETRRALIDELIDQSNMEKLLRDSFANYVIQTCLDYADQDQKAQLVDRIRPHLASIRSTPYGKRIHSKIQREQQQTRYAQRQQHHHSLHYHHPPTLRTSSSAITASSASPYHPTYQDDTNMPSATSTLPYSVNLLGNAHPLYPFP